MTCRCSSLRLEPFDAITAIGVFEHIGHKNYSTFFRIISQNLKNKGRFLLHTLFTPYQSPASNPWMDAHFFPNGEAPPRPYIDRAANGYLILDNHSYPHFQELAHHYPPTLKAWDKNLKRSISEGIISLPIEEQRKWHYFFMSCAGALQVKHLRVGQFRYNKK